MNEDSQHERKALAFYERNQAAMNTGAVVLWPERESLYDLMCLRATIGNAPFASEKQGDPVNPQQCEWDASYFTGGPLPRFVDYSIGMYV